LVSIRGLLIYLTPFIPLSFKGEGEREKEGGFAPLLDAPLDLCSSKKGGGNIRREASPLFDSLYAEAIIGEFCWATSFLKRS